MDGRTDGWMYRQTDRQTGRYRVKIAAEINDAQTDINLNNPCLFNSSERLFHNETLTCLIMATIIYAQISSMQITSSLTYGPDGKEDESIILATTLAPLLFSERYYRTMVNTSR